MNRDTQTPAPAVTVDPAAGVGHHSLTVHEAHELAGDLLRRLVPTIGDEARVESELQRWLDLAGPVALAQVCLAAVQRTFAECLTYPEVWPENGVAFIADKETAR